MYGIESEARVVNPIADFDIDLYEENTVINNYLRKNICKNSRSEPASSSFYMNSYIPEKVERERNRHVIFDGYDDERLEHGLWLDENKNVADLPYKFKDH